MTDGCAPELFADQVRQYLATAEEQKFTAATRVVAPSAIDIFADFEAPPPLEEPRFQEWPETPAPLEVSEVLAAAPVETETEPGRVAEFVEPIAVAPVDVIAPVAAEWGVEETPSIAEASPLEGTSVEDFVVEEFIEEVEAAPVEAVSVEAAPAELTPEPAQGYGDLYVDPMAAQALEELSRQAPSQSLADGIPSEAPVPVVEMQAFQSLDDLASLFAAPPAAASRQETTFFAPPHEEFASLFAAPPAASRQPEPIDVPGIDPSLFASASAAPKRVFEPEPVAAPVPDVAPDLFVEPAPAPEPAPTPVFEAAPEPIFKPAPEPELESAAAPVLERAPEPFTEVTPEPLLTEFEVHEPEPMMAAEFEVESEPVFEDPPLTMAAGTAPAEEASEFDEELDEEIALDVDAFTFTEPEPAEPARFAFTLVDGFGDAWSDFEVPSVAGLAADLGLAEHAPVDPFGAGASAAAIEIRHDESHEPLAAPALDAEALSLIGDAARKVSLDAFVIKEFGGEPKPAKKGKKEKKVHAGAAPVVPTPERPAAKPAPRPVQDEWGMFDPEQAGFAALEDEEGSETRPTTGTRVRVISY